MTTKKQSTEKERTLTVVGVLLFLFAIGLAIALVNVSAERDKYSAIIDTACRYSGDKTACNQGIKVLKSMPLEDIKYFTGR